MTYAQNKEDLFVLKYFGKFRGTLLSIGENDGMTLSNSRLLIETGWKAHLLEPGDVYHDLARLYDGNDLVKTFKIGIGTVDGPAALFESGAHVPNGKDKSLVSSIHYKETERWRKSGVSFKITDINLLTFKSFRQMAGSDQKYEFITIDAEGEDWNILQQIDLQEVGCQCLCIEWNGINDLYDKFAWYCKNFDLYLAHENAENLIFIK